MKLAVCYTRANVGISAQQVAVEVHLSKGLPAFAMVGLPEATVKESRHRVRSAIINSRFEFPQGRITVNLAPAALPKEGGRYDLAIALGILAASQQIPSKQLKQYEFGAELALTGELRNVGGVLPMAIATAEIGRGVFLATEDAAMAARVKGARVYAAENLLAVCEHLKGEYPLEPSLFYSQSKKHENTLDLKDVNGQSLARRALEIAAAGGHGLLMMGSPGVGKTMLASRMPGILPELMDGEALEIETIYSICHDDRKSSAAYVRPFRTPHHSASSVALIGGGKFPRPGEVSLAHNGVLFLDELSEFNRSCLEVLREPLETGVVNISRAAYSVKYPANFQFIAAMNPCPCGYAFDEVKPCRCTPEQVQRYQNKISGPILDRIDLQVKMERVKVSQEVLGAHLKNESSAVVRQRVVAARKVQMDRQKTLNAKLFEHQLTQHCELKEADQRYLANALDNFGLSLRAYHRIIKVARTIADLAGEALIQRAHIQEALWYRQLANSLNKNNQPH